MAQISYKKRFQNFENEVNANGEKVKYGMTSYAIRISKTAFDKIYESVSDFVRIEEIEENMKPYRAGTHYARYALNTNSNGYIEIIFVDEEETVELKEDMVSNHHSFNNTGCFDINIDNAVYAVKYDNHSKQIETNAPKYIKNAIEKWWFI